MGFGEIYNWDGDNGNGIGMSDLGIQEKMEMGCYDKINSDEGKKQGGEWKYLAQNQFQNPKGDNPQTS